MSDHSAASIELRATWKRLGAEPRSLVGGRLGLVVASVAMAAAGVVVALVSATVAGAATQSFVAALDTPSSVVAKPRVGAVTVLWQQLPLSGVTYVVSSSPAGKGCQVVDEASCTIPVTDSIPWR